jgi:hypothetical protein
MTNAQINPNFQNPKRLSNRWRGKRFYAKRNLTAERHDPEAGGHGVPPAAGRAG